MPETQCSPPGEIAQWRSFENRTDRLANEMETMARALRQLAADLRTHVNHLLLEKRLAPAGIDVMNLYIRDLGLSTRARKRMIRLGIENIGQLCQKTSEELLGTPKEPYDRTNFGKASLREVREKLAMLGLHLCGEAPDASQGEPSIADA
jgi:DNA-directed RNA polymerase alpha subunit